MTNELVPTDPPPAAGVWDKLVEVVGDINLPKLIAGPAGQAISRLIAGGADIPAAWLEQKAKSIRDKTEGQSLVAKTLAGAAAELVKNDPALVQRAADAFIAKEIRHQHNRETVAVKAIEHLKETPDAQTTTPNDDWLNVFSRYAEDASSDRLQDLWARILSGELKRPKAFSLRTLRFVSELDEDTTSLFEKWSPSIINSDFIPFLPTEGDLFTELLRLEDVGLITGVAAQVSKIFRDPGSSIPDTIQVLTLGYSFKSHSVTAYIKRPFSFNIRAALLTRIGKEIYGITQAPDSMDTVRSFVQELPKENIQNITCQARSPGAVPEVLWSKPPEPAPTQPEP
ncbi:DUF2806 domain-containing protein [Bradyrhizobium sp. AUGA SZCCT0283]|uniref:DUF2806 domain-containing protein n=1 Tax=Bradyrhizobium sp. AUGA SZCCT0283 TaxID=2807671 RepID=UPI001BAB34A9|nr:DUF2806 domain-containing protein [Bradyrhizobium sp. AUGA SZCCT0283]MBR1279866.1 DUF2806 domain-containing protein [Bradyrhizobium sp. AUGA SZCCT0283]